MPEDLKTAAPVTEEGKVIEPPKEDPKAEDPKSPYDEELARIETEHQRIMGLKDKAIDGEKDKVKALRESLKTEVVEEMERRQAARDAKRLLGDITPDETAQKVIMHHFENLPASLRTGDVEEDLQTALALANRKRVGSLLNQEAMGDKANERSISYMGGGDLPGASSFRGTPSAVTSAAVKLAKMAAGKDQDLSKKLEQRLKAKPR